MVAGIALFGAALFSLVKAKGWGGFTNKAALASTSQYQSIDQKLGEIDKRLIEVERDLEDRPTREELHVIEKTLVAINESSKARDDQIRAIGAGVRRVEDFLISLSKGK